MHQRLQTHAFRLSQHGKHWFNIALIKLLQIEPRLHFEPTEDKTHELMMASSCQGNVVIVVVTICPVAAAAAAAASAVFP